MSGEVVWQPRGRVPERLCLYGPQSCGKTKAIADMLSAGIGPGQTAYIVDTDNSWARFLEGGNYPKLEVRAEWEDGEWVDEWTVEGGRVVLLHVAGWEQFRFAMEHVWGEAARGDWVVIDSITHPWAEVASWYIEKVHGTELPDFMIQARMKQVSAGKGADGGAGEMLMEWNFINKEWNRAFLTPYVNAKCHVVVTAEAKTLRTDDRGDRKDVKDLYASVGMKPDTQRRVGANSQTVLYFEQGRVGRDVQWYVTTAKERERERLTRVDWTDVDFAKVYLWDVAGWRPKKMTNE